MLSTACSSEEKGTGAGASIPVWLFSAWVRRGLTVPTGVPKMWEEGRLKVEPAREKTCWEDQTPASVCLLVIYHSWTVW